MFAVPGWSVSCGDLKTQTVESPEQQVLLPLKYKDSQSDTAAKPSKKRKRNYSTSKVFEVNSANFVNLWEAVIEKKNDAKNQKSERDRARKEKKVPPTLRGRVQSARTGEALREKDITDAVSERASNLDLNYNNGEQIKLNRDTKSLESSLCNLPTASSSATELTPMQASMRQKLVSARFRYLNETLYAQPSADSFKIFQHNPEMFQEYHAGFRRQVQIWPENPVDGYISQITLRGMYGRQIRVRTGNNKIGIGEGLALEAPVLPRSDGICHIADLGCGDAFLSLKLEKMKKKLKLEVFSYDLQSSNPLVTKADIADLPLKDGSIDIAIFCLSLMGTNWIDFIEEAFRILRWKGELWVAEIKSRFKRMSNNNERVDHSVGNRKKPKKAEGKMLEEGSDNADLLGKVDGYDDNKEETDVSAFVDVLSKRGFAIHYEKGVDVSNKMFVTMKFTKAQTPVKGKCVPVPKGIVGVGLNTWKKKSKAKYLDEDKTPSGNEASVLKPCVYKLR